MVDIQHINGSFHGILYYVCPSMRSKASTDHPRITLETLYTLPYHVPQHVPGRRQLLIVNQPRYPPRRPERTPSRNTRVTLQILLARHNTLTQKFLHFPTPLRMPLLKIGKGDTVNRSATIHWTSYNLIDRSVNDCFFMGLRCA